MLDRRNPVNLRTTLLVDESTQQVRWALSEPTGDKSQYLPSPGDEQVDTERNIGPCRGNLGPVAARQLGKIEMGSYFLARANICS
jgi:hypothetical protein